MKRLVLAMSIIALAVGCAPAPDQTPVSSPTPSENTTTAGISVPDEGTEGDVEGTTLVTLNVPGMT